METKFKDVAHLYLGCMVKTHPKFIPNRKERIEGKRGFAKLTENLLADEADRVFPFRLIPVLYPLSSMTIEQEDEMISKSGELTRGWKHDIKCNAVRTQYLLSHSFDLFELIESGQAIDATTIDISQPKPQ